MQKNVGTVDRVLRGLGAIAMGVAAALVPLPLWARVPVFGLLAVYLAFSTLSGTCLGYRLMGRSTCPTRGLQ